MSDDQEMRDAPNLDAALDAIISESRANLTPSDTPASSISDSALNAPTNQPEIGINQVNTPAAPFNMFAPYAAHPSFVRDSASNSFKLQAYLAEDLMQSICSFIDNTNTNGLTFRLSVAEREALRKVASKEYAKLDVSNRDDLAEMKKEIRILAEGFYPIFDKMFFKGGLERYVSEIVIFTIDEVKAQDPQHMFIKTEAIGFFEENSREIHLRVNPRQLPRGQTEVQSYLAILVHEMVHAFFHAWTCRCNNQCSQTELKTNYVGKSHHGIAWAQVMYSITRALKTHSNRNWLLDTGIAISLIREQEASGIKVSHQMLASWDCFRMDLSKVKPNDVPEIWHKNIGICPLRVTTGLFEGKDFIDG